MRLSRFVRRIVVVAAFAVTTLMVPAGTASAMPRNFCQDLLNQAAVDLGFAGVYLDYAKLYYSAGDYFMGYIYEAASDAYFASAEESVATYEASCH
jgi:hypothetical protein